MRVRTVCTGKPRRKGNNRDNFVELYVELYHTYPTPRVIGGLASTLVVYMLSNANMITIYTIHYPTRDHLGSHAPVTLLFCYVLCKVRRPTLYSKSGLTKLMHTGKTIFIFLNEKKNVYKGQHCISFSSSVFTVLKDY